MPNKSSIEWTDYTSNPIYAINIATGKRGHHCVHKNPLCEKCYAESINLRWGTGLRFIAQNSDKVSFVLSVKELDALSKLDVRLLKRGERAKVFMFDMTDIGLPDIPRHFVFEVLDRIATVCALTVQLLTKRPDEVLSIVKEYCAARGDMPPEKFKEIFAHVHMGASVGTQRTADEDIPKLIKLNPYFDVLWLSIEPLLEAVDLGRAHPCGYYCDRVVDDNSGFVFSHHDHDFITPLINTRIKWIVCGGESGSGARPCDINNIRSIVEQCRAAQVPCFVKQLGAKPFETRPAEGQPQGVEYALANLNKTHPQQGWFTDWTLVHNGGSSAWYRYMKPSDRKGGAMEEWPEDLRIRQFPLS